jgi:uncharacterized membrane protein
MKELFEIVTVAVEAAAVTLLLFGLIISTGRFIFGAARGPTVTAYRIFRRELGRTLMLTLELLIAADIIDTVAVEMSLESLGMLGLLVLIRTFLSVALELEVTGRWPWQGGDDRPAADA